MAVPKVPSPSPLLISTKAFSNAFKPSLLGCINVVYEIDDESSVIKIVSPIGERRDCASESGRGCYGRRDK
jgi:hypothetical protein